MMKLLEVLDGVSYKVIKGSLDKEIINIQYDSRKVSEADIFVCLSGFEVDGHDIPAIVEALKAPVSGKPKFICCNTVKGKGVSFMEDQSGWHGKVRSAEDFEKAMKELEA